MSDLTTQVPSVLREHRTPCVLPLPVAPHGYLVVCSHTPRGIWHFACHGIHDPGDPLESSLVLCDGRLRLRTIFARPASSRRLAVLSACRIATAGEALLDEVVSLPSALLQAGVATNGEIHAALAEVHPHPAGRTAAQLAYWEHQRAFAQPHCWAAFSYCGA